MCEALVLVCTFLGILSSKAILIPSTGMGSVPKRSFLFLEVSYLPRQGGNLYQGKNFIKFKKGSNDYLVVILGGGSGSFMFSIVVRLISWGIVHTKEGK